MPVGQCPLGAGGFAKRECLCHDHAELSVVYHLHESPQGIGFRARKHRDDLRSRVRHRADARVGLTSLADGNRGSGRFYER